MTAKSLNCWYRARWAEGFAAIRGTVGERSQRWDFQTCDTTTFCWKIRNLFNICVAAWFKDLREKLPPEESETQSHKKLCSELESLQTKNFLCSPNVIQNIFVRDLNFPWFRRFTSPLLKATWFRLSTRLSMHKSLIFRLPLTTVETETFADKLRHGLLTDRVCLTPTLDQICAKLGNKLNMKVLW